VIGLTLAIGWSQSGIVSTGTTTTRLATIRYRAGFHPAIAPMPVRTARAATPSRRSLASAGMAVD
jgi:hypothetical protein